MPRRATDEPDDRDEHQPFRLSPLAWSAATGRWAPAPPSPPPPGAAPAQLRLLTWNVWFGEHRFEARRAALLARIEALRPDVVALQEVTIDLLEPLLREAWLRAGYQVCIQVDERHRPLGNYGVVLLSRIPVRHLVQLPLPSEMGRAVLVAELAGGAPVTVATVHLESLGEAQRRVEQLRLIREHLGPLAGDVVLLGDMNFNDEAAAERAALDPAFADLWPALCPGEPGFTVDTDVNTMRLQVNGRPSRKRIDRVLHRADRLRPATIALEGTTALDEARTFVSDHFGLLVDLEPAAPRGA